MESRFGSGGHSHAAVVGTRADGPVGPLQLRKQKRAPMALGRRSRNVHILGAIGLNGEPLARSGWWLERRAGRPSSEIEATRRRILASPDRQLLAISAQNIEVMSGGAPVSASEPVSGAGVVQTGGIVLGVTTVSTLESGSAVGTSWVLDHAPDSERLALSVSAPGAGVSSATSPSSEDMAASSWGTAAV